jgi:hypothetical protein
MTVSAAGQHRPRQPPAVIIPFLNGMAHVEALTGRFGPAVLGGTLRIATQLEDDGTIRTLTPQFDVELGELDGSPSTRVDRLASAFKDAGADVTVPGNVVDAMWAKWVFIPGRARPHSRDRHPADRPGRACPADPQPADPILSTTVCLLPVRGLSHPVRSENSLSSERAVVLRSVRRVGGAGNLFGRSAQRSRSSRWSPTRMALAIAVRAGLTALMLG